MKRTVKLSKEETEEIFRDYWNLDQEKVQNYNITVKSIHRIGLIVEARWEIEGKKGEFSNTISSNHKIKSIVKKHHPPDEGEKISGVGRVYRENRLKVYYKDRILPDYSRWPIGVQIAAVVIPLVGVSYFAAGLTVAAIMFGLFLVFWILPVLYRYLKGGQDE